MKAVFTSCFKTAFCFLLISVPGAFANENNGLQKEVQAVRISDHTLRLDGVLDDEVWQNAKFVSGFLQKDPNEGAPALHKTEVAIVYDNHALYIGGRMFFENPDEIRAFVTRRDNAGSSERLIVSLDTYHDKRTAYSFAVTAAGVRVDYYHPADSEYDREYSFNPVWEAETFIDDRGWSAEMKIPFSQLRFRNEAEQVWGVNFNRWVPNSNEDLYWVLIGKNETGWASRFGKLTGIRDIQPARRLELLPYTASSAQYKSDIDHDDPFADGSRYDARVGMDFKMGLGPNLTLDATINPDFGQVEADPAVVNLSAFETFFDEKRPFFIEGSQLFDNVGPTFFYSRRIGAEPHGSPDDEFEADTTLFSGRPENTTILGAAKLSGRLSSGLSIGVLTALTASEDAEVFIPAQNPDNAFREQTEVEPPTGYGVVRMQQEFGPSQSYVGLMLTGVRRDVQKGSYLASALNRQAYTGNIDWNVRFQGGKYELQGYAGFSHINGDSSAIIRAQRSSARYYQRPDADYVSLDSTRTSLSGYAGSLEFEKNSGKHWLWGTGAYAESPGLELNDAGILFSGDGIGGWGYLRYRETQPGNIFRDYSLEASTSLEWNFGGVRTFSILDFFFNFRLKNFWQTNLHYHYRPASQSHSLTRGGPLMGVPSDQHVQAQVSGNPANNFNWRTRVSYIWDELDGFDFTTSASFSFKPADPLELSIEPEYERQRNSRQYFDELDGGRAETFGNRYIFSFIERSTLSTQFRINYAITPDLSLELYAEPFAASGNRFNFGELLAPRSQDLLFYDTEELPDGSIEVQNVPEPFTLENGDFNITSFRSNFVLRWEWRPGSTLFLVWSQDRRDEQSHGRFVTPGTLFDSVTRSGDNFFALKLSYWLPVN